MDEGLLAIFGSLFVMPISIAVMIIYLRRFTNSERLKLIETGGDPSLITSKPNSGKFNTLRFALLLMGVGLGFLLGSLLDKSFDLDEVGYFAMLFLCGGGGLMAAYLIESGKEKE